MGNLADIVVNRRNAIDFTNHHTVAPQPTRQRDRDAIRPGWRTESFTGAYDTIADTEVHRWQDCLRNIGRGDRDTRLIRIGETRVRSRNAELRSSDRIPGYVNVASLWNTVERSDTGRHQGPVIGGSGWIRQRVIAGSSRTNIQRSKDWARRIRRHRSGRFARCFRSRLSWLAKRVS